MFIFLPLLLNGILLLGLALFWDRLWAQLLVIPLFFFLIYLIYSFGKNVSLPSTFLSRYAPFIAPILFTLVLWLLMATVNDGNFSTHKGAPTINYGLFAFLPFFAFLFMASFGGVDWFLPVSTIASYLFFTACFAVGTWRGKRFKTTKNKPALPMLELIIALAVVAAVQGYVQKRAVLQPDPNHAELREWYDRYDYSVPWHFQEDYEGVKLAVPKTPPSLQIDRDYPKLDGAEALIPVYAAAANAIYRKIETPDDKDNKTDSRWKTVSLSRASPAAYKVLLDGKADMIFAAAPSEEQKKEAAEKGITYTLTPIGKEAFVFLVNEQNPMTSLSVEQIRDIYSGKINDWKEVGGAPAKIMAFQRNQGSGSQTAMLRLMGETPIRKPLEAESIGSMGGLLRGVADYRNLDSAIGYSFRYYATVMNSVPGIRLLAVNGVAPTTENIRNGTYPFTKDFYIVTARPLSENAAKLRDWFVSDEGQRFIAETGYVPLK
jgi:phosphate transport system substrate-binding protein